MRFRFEDDGLRELYRTGKGGKQYSADLVRAFQRTMTIIKAAASEQDLRAFKGLRFEKLSGQRSHQHSLRLNAQWRLIISIATDDQGKYLLIINIEDYH